MTRRSSWRLVLAVAALSALAPTPADAIERWYSRGVFPLIQHAFTSVSNLFPFAIFDALWAGAIAGTVVMVRRRVKTSGWGMGLLRAVIALVRAVAVLYLVFLLTWGLNYRRVPMIHKVVFHPERISRTAQDALGQWAVTESNGQYGEAHRLPESLTALRSAFEEVQLALDGQSIVPGRPKDTLLGWYFHQASISGMTDPFLLETMVAPDLLDVERPFVIAHEWAHLAGYADESEANYVAYLACHRGDARARYSAALVMIGYASPQVGLRRLEIGPRTDLYAIRTRYLRTSPVVRNAAREGYDRYLKANRVERGVESYDAVVQLILATELDERGLPRVR